MVARKDMFGKVIDILNDSGKLKIFERMNEPVITVLPGLEENTHTREPQAIEY
jgi:hypothetical protein